MKRYMQQRTFDHGAATLARIHLLGKGDVAQTAAQIALEYRASYSDQNLATDWKTAALEALRICEDLDITDSEADAILSVYPYYVENFDEKGKRLPLFKRIGGAYFHYEKNPIPNLVQSFRNRFSRFAVMGKAGILLPEWIPPSARR